MVSLARAAITNHERGDLLTLARKMEMDNLVPGAFKACPRISMCRGRGIGRALVSGVRRAARDAGCCRVELLSSKDLSRAHAFYRTVGFGAVAEGFRADLRNWPEPALKRDER